MTKCRSCGALITFARTQAGSTIPLDIAPVRDGNVEMVGRNPGDPLPLVAVRPKGYEWAANVKRFQSHFVSCSRAAEHRRRP